MALCITQHESQLEGQIKNLSSCVYIRKICEMTDDRLGTAIPEDAAAATDAAAAVEAAAAALLLAAAAAAVPRSAVTDTAADCCSIRPCTAELSSAPPPGCSQFTVDAAIGRRSLATNESWDHCRMCRTHGVCETKRESLV